MNVGKLLLDLARAVADEAERNPGFRDDLLRALQHPKAEKLGQDSQDERAERPAKNRRKPALLNPIEVVQEGESSLRARLSPLTLDDLRDIVAEYGMDPGKLVMKWKTPERVIDRIVEVSLARSRKGDAFR